jgi:hypothetical protein
VHQTCYRFSFRGTSKQNNCLTISELSHESRVAGKRNGRYEGKRKLKTHQAVELKCGEQKKKREKFGRLKR